jgi:heme A synthase
MSWPLCNGGLGAPPDLLSEENVAHRVIALAAVIFVAIATAKTLKLHRGYKPLTIATRSLHGLLGLQIVVGAAMVLAMLQPALRGLHIAMASAAWGAAVLIVLFVHTAKAQ